MTKDHMTREEFFICIKLLRKYYSRAALFRDTDVIEQWYEDLKGFPYILVNTSIKAWVLEHAFPPSLAEIRASPKKILHWMDVQEVILHDNRRNAPKWQTKDERLLWGCREYLRQLTDSDQRGS